MSVALINGKAYSHADIVFNVAGVPIASLDSLTINTGKLKNFHYGVGDLPVSYGEGKKTPIEMTFKISMVDGVAWENAISSKDLNDSPLFDIPVTYLNEGKPRLEIYKNILIQSANKSSDTETTDIMLDITAIASNVIKK